MRPSLKTILPLVTALSLGGCVDSSQFDSDSTHDRAVIKIDQALGNIEAAVGGKYHDKDIVIDWQKAGGENFQSKGLIPSDIREGANYATGVTVHLVGDVRMAVQCFVDTTGVTCSVADVILDDGGTLSVDVSSGKTVKHGTGHPDDKIAELHGFGPYGLGKSDFGVSRLAMIGTGGDDICEVSVHDPNCPDERFRFDFETCGADIARVKKRIDAVVDSLK